MRICPHCQSVLPPEVSRCPRCGASYWEPGRAGEPQHDAPPKSSEPEGCASVLVLPLLSALGVTALLILAGFSLHALARFESLSFRLLWLAASCAAGAWLYRTIRRRRGRSDKEAPPDEGGTFS